MTALLRAEFRKLLTIRSTYIISILALLLVGFLAFYVFGYRGEGAPGAYWLASLIGDTSTIIATFVAIVAILHMGHEYRYSMIMYTLTSANSRTKVLLAKLVTIATYAAAMTVIATLFALVAYWAGVMVSPDRALIAPEFFWSDVWHAFFFVGAYALLGLLFAFLFRHLVGAIAALFILPTVEALVGGLLNDNAKFLPMTSLEQVHTHSLWSSGEAALLFTGYMAVAWLVAWLLFLRRDAN